MLLGSVSIGETHYNVLSLTENASYDEIRASYRSAILNCHPDKLHNEFNTSHHHPNPEDRFLKVQKAWEVLSCSKSRVAYDLELQAAKGDAIVAEDISLEDMICEEEDEVVELFHQCRCGDYFYVDSSELEKMGYKLLRGVQGEVSFRTTDALPAFIILPCGSCSLRLRLSINSEDYRTDTIAQTFLHFSFLSVINYRQVHCEEEDEVVELFHQCRCGDYFYVDSSELEKMGYKLLRGVQGEVSFRTIDALPAFIILPCGSCSLRLRLSINSEHLNFGGGFVKMSNSTEKFKLSIASLKVALCMCQPCDEPLLNSQREEDWPSRNGPEEDEEVVLPIQIQSLGKKKLKEERMLSKDGLPWVYLFLTGPKAQQQTNGEEDRDEFVSTKSGLTCSSICASIDDFLSAKITFSSPSSPDRIQFDFLDSQSLRRLSIIQELCHCEGWPFGLCRKLVLFPPLPKSPTDSWSWRKAKIT